jgi:threonyl-tRNA synthetase
MDFWEALSTSSVVKPVTSCKDFSTWLSPTQVRIIPLRPEFQGFAEEVATKLASLNVRADIDDRDESVDKRVREAELNWIPFIAVLGRRELQSKLVAVRRRSDGKQYNVTLEELAKEIAANTVGYPAMPLRLPMLLTKRPGYKQIV